jgi:hypothetical protein
VTGLRKRNNITVLHIPVQEYTITCPDDLTC